MKDWEFFKGKKILVTGHTGFKGSWMCRMLLELGAEVTGYALEPAANPALFTLCGLQRDMESVIADVRDLGKLDETFKRTKPELVVHMAAQPIVREGYRRPVYTYDVNIMGTVNVLECVREHESVKSFLNVTTDKVYRNREQQMGYKESDELGGYDPYSNSKSCSELVTESYCNSFFGKDTERNIPISTARAGNVIGGGDFAADRIIPDCVRAALGGEKIQVRNPKSVRPYQHVLEPIAVYLMILKGQCEKDVLAGSYNVGPEEKDCLYTAELVELFCREWKRFTGEKVEWGSTCENGPHEAGYLKLDCSKLRRTFSWKPLWDAEKAVEKTVEWYASYALKEDVNECMRRQIEDYLRGK